MSHSTSAAGKPAQRQSQQQTIDTNDERDVKRWMDEFGATQEQILEAVNAVGNDVAKVRDHLLHQGASAGAS